MRSRGKYTNHRADVEGTRLGIGDRERLLLHAYLHFERQHGGACGKSGLCWPSDSEVAEHLGCSAVTVRRLRWLLRDRRLGAQPFIAVHYVPPFGRLPNGKTSLYGVNVVTLLDVAGPCADAPRTEYGHALAETRRLELELAKAYVALGSRRLLPPTGAHGSRP